MPANPKNNKVVIPFSDDLYCPDCGYNLRGLRQDQCPECGSPFDRAQLTGSNLPWVRHQAEGTWRAYLKTVWLVTVRQRRFFEEYRRPVNFAHARRFRHTTAWLLTGMVGLLATVVLLWDSGSRLISSKPQEVFIFGLAWLLYLGCILLFLLNITGVTSYYFHPRRLPVERQNRAVALCHYACAPLAWIPAALIAGVVIGWFVFGPLPGRFTGGIVILPCFLLSLIPVVSWWFLLIRLARTCLKPSRASLVLFGIGLPVAWFAIGVLNLIVLPLLLIFPFLLLAVRF